MIAGVEGVCYFAEREVVGRAVAGSPKASIMMMIASNQLLFPCLLGITTV